MTNSIFEEFVNLTGFSGAIAPIFHLKKLLKMTFCIGLFRVARLTMPGFPLRSKL